MKYFLIGVDSEKYGPYDVDRLKELALEKRIITTSTLINEETGESIQASNVINFNEINIPPVIEQETDNPKSNTSPVSSYEPKNNNNVYIKNPQSQITILLSVASFVLSLSALAFIGLITAIIAVYNTKKENSSRTLPIIAIVISSTFMVLYPVIGLIIYNPVTITNKDQAKYEQCSNNMKQIGFALTMYATDNDERLPISSNWEDALEPYLKNKDKKLFENPINNRSSYAMNKYYSDDSTEYLHGGVLIFEASLGIKEGDEKDVFIPDDPKKGIFVIYCDGHVRLVAPEFAINNVMLTEVIR